MKINILGAEWTIHERTEKEEPRLKDSDGLTDWTTREIIIEKDMQGNLADMGAYVRKVKRHEIVHAFLDEGGLRECSGSTDAWATNETMVDWIARVGPSIYRAWQDADAL